jgi:CheY-like chemotaxis protein
MTMEKHSVIIRGLINDLLRALSASLVHADDWIMKLEQNSDGFSDAILANEQISRSIELFLDLRSEFIYLNNYLNINNNLLMDESLKFNKYHLNHCLSELYTTILGYYDLILMDNNRKYLLDNIALLLNSINKYMYCEDIIDDNIVVIDSELIIAQEDKEPINYKEELISSIKSKFINNRILLVEDNDDVRKVISIALHKEGYTILEAYNGKSAINLFYEQHKEVNLCLIDIGLPDMSGVQLCNELISNNNKLKILFISGQDRSILNKYNGLLGKFNFIKKPFRLKRLIDSVKDICNAVDLRISKTYC